MYAEVAIQAVKWLRIEGGVYGHDVAVGADGDEQYVAVASLEFEAHLSVSGGGWPGAWYRSGNPDLIGRIPELPNAESVGALDREVVPLAIDDLVGLVLDAKRRLGIFHVLVESENEVRGSGIGAETLPPQRVRPGGSLAE